MGGCSVFNCNSRESDYKMYRFPERKKCWTEKCGIIGWEPTNNSRICEVITLTFIFLNLNYFCITILSITVTFPRASFFL